MHIYIDLAYVAMALALCGGFLFGQVFPTKTQEKVANDKAFKHYRAKYNEQLGEALVRVNQERAAMIHRYQGLAADLETEIAALRRAVDPERTTRSIVDSKEEAV